MIGMLQWVTMALLWTVTDLRLSNKKGLLELRDLDVGLAAQMQRRYRAPWSQRSLLGAAALFAGIGVWSAAIGSWWYAAQAVVSLVAALLAWRVHHVAASKILAVLSERDLSAASFEQSALRTRRVTQLSTVAGVVFVASSIALTIAAIANVNVAFYVGVGLLSVSLLAVAGAGWAAVWRYGDEVSVQA